jgi:hypothetical protein
MTLDKFTKQAKDAANKAMDASRQAALKAKETAEQLKDVGKEKGREALDRALAEFAGLKPILADCGFIVGDIVFSMPIPEILVTLEHVEGGKQTLEQVLAEKHETLTDFQKIALNLLARANEMVEVTNRYGYTFRKYDLDLTVPPKVSIHLVSLKSKG